MRAELAHTVPLLQTRLLDTQDGTEAIETNDGDGRPFILIVLATDPFVPKHRLRGRLIRTCTLRHARTHTHTTQT